MISPENLGTVLYQTARGRDRYSLKTRCGKLELEVGFGYFERVGWHYENREGASLEQIYNHVVDAGLLQPETMSFTEFAANVELFTKPLPAKWEKILGEALRSRQKAGVEGPFHLSDIINYIACTNKRAWQILNTYFEMPDEPSLGYTDGDQLGDIINVFLTHAVLRSLFLKTAPRHMPYTSSEAIDREGIISAMRMLLFFGTGTVVDIGSGDGTMANAIGAMYPNATVVGIDPQKRRNPVPGTSNVSFEQCDFLRYKPQSPVTVFNCTALWSHLSEEMCIKIVKQAYAHLIEGGAIVSAAQNNGNLGSENQISIYIKKGGGFEFLGM